MTGALIIGSTAMQGMYPGVRKAEDVDLWSPDSWDKWFDGRRADVFWDDRLQPLLDKFPGIRCATRDELYTIKVSHSYWELHSTWNKHLYDIVQLKKVGAKLDLELHDLLYEVWSDLHGHKVLNLGKESDEFFSDAVTRRYVHDSLHASVAYGDRPMYESLLKPGKSVQMDMGRVKSLPEDEIARLFREEVYVTALERILVPKDYHYSPMAAYAWALRRTITGLTKGWSARWLIEHYDVMRRPDMDYVAVHLANKDKLIELEAA